MNKLIGLIGTTLGGALIGAGIQRTYMLGNKISSGISKLMGNGGMQFDNTTWVLLICGALILVVGVYFSGKKG